MVKDEDTVVTRTDLNLIITLKKKYPELSGLTATSIIDWALRKAIISRDEELKKEA